MVHIYVLNRRLPPKKQIFVRQAKWRAYKLVANFRHDYIVYCFSAFFCIQKLAFSQQLFELLRFLVEQNVNLYLILRTSHVNVFDLICEMSNNSSPFLVPNVIWSGSNWIWVELSSILFIVETNANIVWCTLVIDAIYKQWIFEIVSTNVEMNRCE